MYFLRNEPCSVRAWESNRECPRTVPARSLLVARLRWPSIRSAAASLHCSSRVDKQLECSGNPALAAASAIAQPIVERESAAAGQIQHQRSAHDRKVLAEVRILIARLRRRIFPVTMRQRSGNDQIDESEQRCIASCDAQNECDPDCELSQHSRPDPEAGTGHFKARQIGGRA